MKINIRDSNSSFGDTIEPRKIYKFSSNKINTPILHYFICIVRDDGDFLVMTCCTSQFEKRKKFIEARPDIPNSTLVWIDAPNDDNHLTKETYIDCNNYIEYSVAELQQKYNQEEITFEGEISEVHFLQIIQGLLDSPEIEDEIKEMLPII